MEIDIDSIIGGLLEWDLKISINGLLKSTKPLTLGDLALLLEAMKNPQRADLIGAICRIFEGSETEIRKWVEGWRMEKMLAVVTAVVKYFKDKSGKNSPAIAAQVEAAMAKASS
jgi:chromosome segregation and condensation protein ScpB